jgi:catechol 2,3-dioxygenase-like lactoylglutathione lyase family enzyme
MKFEIVVIPVSDVDRAKRFYGGLGWRLDADFASGDGWRVIQFTPPGSGSSVIFGKNVTAAAPGSAQGLYLIVPDIEAARHELLGRGVEISEVFHDAGDLYAGTNEPYLFGRVRVSGPDPEHRSYRSYASFSDPDGNGWLLQEVTARLPGRVDTDVTTFTSRPNSRARFDVPRRHTASTRSGQAASVMRTGQPGMPSTSSTSTPASRCRSERRRRSRHRPIDQRGRDLRLPGSCRRFASIAAAPAQESRKPLRSEAWAPT